MGCWNGTCMISNLPIISGEKIKLVILKPHLGKKEITSSGFCYSTGLMSPAFLPIEGEYDDYGTIEDIVEDWNTEFVLKNFTSVYDALEVDKEVVNEYTLYDICRGIERGSLKGKKKNSEEFIDINLAFVMIRKDIWDALCINHKGQFWNDRKEETDKCEYYISARESCDRQYQKSVDALAELDELRKSDTEDVELKLLRRSLILMNKNIFYDNRILKTINYDHSYLVLFERELDLREAINSLYTELVIINSFLESTRKSWMIQQGAGSQDADWEEYKMFNQIVNEICDAKIKEYSEEYED